MSHASAIEKVLIGGDLSALTETDRITYYQRVCDSLGLNPLTQPFRYIKLSGALTLYATRAASEQLASNHKVAVTFVSDEFRDGVYLYRVKATTPDGRAAPGTGVVPVEGLKGEALCNAMMKAETKACRRATLRVCGLGMLDESEVETVRVEQSAPAELPPKQNGTHREAEPDESEWNPVEKQPDLAVLAKSKGHTWAACVARIASQFSKQYPANVKFADLPLAERAWLVAQLDGMPDVGAKA